MALFRNHLPQLGSKLFLTDGGAETTLIYHEELELPDFAAFPLLRDRRTRIILESYYLRYTAIARSMGLGFILESPTWRANPDWGKRLGYSKSELEEANKDAIRLLENIRATEATMQSPMVISGCIGPRGDGYQAGELMSATEAQRYHQEQIGAFASSSADLVSAITMTNVPEAIGIAVAAREAQVPCVISFTAETDGRLPAGETLEDAIDTVDEATDAYPAYYMINCAHPEHFAKSLVGASIAARLRGIRANASRMSHEELDVATELDDGNPHELGDQYAELMRVLPRLTVLGGCCGTDHRHVEAIAQACAGSLQNSRESPCALTCEVIV